EPFRALRSRQLKHRVAPAVAGLRGWNVAVREVRLEALPAPAAHQPRVDVARRFLAEAHGEADVGRPADQVAAGVKLAAAGFERVTVHRQRAVLPELEARGAR